MKSKRKIGLVAFFALTLLLFNQPLISISKGLIAGLPTLLLYLLILWVLVIILLHQVFRDRKPDRDR